MKPTGLIPAFLLAGAAASPAGLPAAQAAGDLAVPQLDAVLVRPQGGSLTVPDAAAAAEALGRVPGNVSLIDAGEYREQAVMSLRDALSRTGGVYVQNPAGQETSRLSIRGSGIATPFGTRGVRLLRDGLPLSRADGAADTPYADPNTADYIEVWRGANALQYGAATLGGAINLVSPTGYTARGARLRLEAGSDGYLRTQARAGQVFGNGLDAFVSASGFRTDGSREHTGQRISRFYGNIGYRFSPNSEGRLHVDAERQMQERPGSLTLAQLQRDPQQRGTMPAVGDRLDVGPRSSVAYQHAWRLGADSLSIGLSRAATVFDVQGGFAALRYDSTDYSIAARHDMKRSLDGRALGITWGFNHSQGSSHNTTHGPIRYESFVLADDDRKYEEVHGRRRTTEIYGEARYAVAERITLVAGAQAVHARRSARIEPVAPSPLIPLPPYPPVFEPEYNNVGYTGFSPKLGLLWDAAPGVQGYANLNRSYEPPTSFEFANARGPLDAQRATTMEIGARGATPALQWDVAVYHSRVRDELLSVEWPPGSARYLSGNISRTSHTGLEATLAGTVALPALAGRLDWNLAYTWNRFRIRDDAAFRGNALPGIPPHFGRVELVYRHRDGFFAGPSVEFASRWQADQANTIEAPGYGVVNFRVGWADPGGRYLVFLDARNLADKRYAATTDYAVDAAGQDLPIYSPGLSRSLFAVVQLAW